MKCVGKWRHWANLLPSVYRLYALHGAEFLDELVEHATVFHHYGQDTREEPVVGRVNADGAKHNLLLFRDDARDVIDNAEVIVANDVEGDGIGASALSCPLRSHDAVGEALLHGFCVGAIDAVNLDTAA